MVINRSYPYIGVGEDSDLPIAAGRAQCELDRQIEGGFFRGIDSSWEVCDLKVSVIPTQEVLGDGTADVSYKVVASAVVNYYGTEQSS